MTIYNFSVSNDGYFSTAPANKEVVEGALIRISFPDQPLGLLRNKAWKLNLTNLTSANFVATEGMITSNNNVFDIETVNIFSNSSSIQSFIIQIYSSLQAIIDGDDPLLTVIESIIIKGSASDITITHDKPNGIKEGESITYYISTRNLPNGTLLPYNIDGFNSITDFEIEVQEQDTITMSNTPLVRRVRRPLSSREGSIPIVNNRGSLTLFLVEDNIEESSDTIKLQLFKPAINISSYSISPSSLNVNEGDTITFNIRTTNVPDDTVLFWTNEGTTRQTDFVNSGMVGSLYITNNQASFQLTLMADIRTESTEDILIKLRRGSPTGEVLASTSRILVNDTSNTSFANGNFSVGLTGWDIYNQEVQLNGLSEIGGYPTPQDNKPDELGSSMQFSTSISTQVPPGLSAEARSVRLFNQGITSSYGTSHGPYIISKNPVALEVDDEVTFWWKAEGGSDAYDIYAYLLNINDGRKIELANATGESSSGIKPWTNVSKKITSLEKSANSSTPDYKFVFISGSYDFSGGQATGASLYITEIKVVKHYDIAVTPPTYFLSTNATSVNRGDRFVIRLSTRNLNYGSQVPYLISGIDVNDISGLSFTGSFTVGSSNVGLKQFTVNRNSLSTGVKQFTLTLLGIIPTVSITVTVNF